MSGSLRRPALTTALALPWLAIFLPVGAAWAAGCDTFDWTSLKNMTVPDCDLRVQGPLKFSGWESKGWAYYCTSDHPYAWNFNQGYSKSFTFDNNCFSVAENGSPEVNNSSKFDFTMTNWCFKSETITISIACSSQAPPGCLVCSQPTLRKQ